MSKNVVKSQKNKKREKLDYWSIAPYMHPMSMQADDIKRLVKQALPDAAVELTDLAGDGDHYSIVVTSAAFKDKTRIAQHRMVTDALGGGMGTTLHALSVTTRVA